MTTVIKGNLNELEIIDPPEASFSYFLGETRTLKYKLHNHGQFPIKDFDIKAKSLLKFGETVKDTKKNYCKVNKIPRILPAGKTKEFDVEVSVPLDYSETINKDGEEILYPFRVSLSIKSIKHMTEL